MIECGVCGGDNSVCADCAGVPNGDNLEDNCGTCDANSSNDCVQDCAGTWGGDLVIDECNICDGDNSTCADCNGVPNGDGLLDMCGTCDADSSNDCVQDCAGVWGGTDEFTDYYLDADGDGLGSGDPANICSASAPDGWVTNGDDTDDDCYSNYHDECNVCDGDNSTCADCNGVPNGDTMVDECGCF